MTRNRKISMFSFILLPVVLLAVYSFLQTRKSLISSVYAERRNLVSVSAGMLHEKLDRLREVGLSLAEWPVFTEHFDDAKWDHTIEMMRKIPKDFPYISRVIITDTAGITKASVPGTDNKANNFKWYGGIRKTGDPYLSEVYTDPAMPGQVLSGFAVTLKDHTGKQKGILVLEVDVYKLLSWSDQINVGKTGFVYIVDQKGQVAINPQHKGDGKIIDYASVPAVQKALKGVKGVEVLYNPVIQEERLSAYQHVDDYGWAVIVQEEAGAALSVSKNLWPVFIFYAFVIILAAFFARYIIVGIARQNKTEAELKRYVDVVEHTHVLVRDLNDRVIFWNKGMEDLYGWKNAEVTGRVTHEFFKTVFHAPLGGIKKELLENGHWQGEVTQRRKDGALMEVASHWQLHRDADGNPAAIIETNYNITEVKTAREKLRRSEENIKLLVDNVKDYAIFGIDAAGRVTSWNEGARHMKGYSESEINGRSFERFYTAQDIENGIPARNLSLTAASGHYETEGWRVRKNGSLFYANVVFTALKDPEGRLYGFSKITRDITAAKKAQEQLQLLLMQINQANDAIYTLDAERKVLSWNLGAQKLYGFTEAEAVGRDSVALLETQLTGQEVAAALQKIKDDNYWSGELKRKTKNGEEIIVRASTTGIVDADGKITGYLAVSFDITREKALQKQVKYLASIVEQSSEAIVSRGMDNRLITWNSGAEKMLGYNKAEALGKTAGELGFVRLAEPDRQALAKEIEEKGSWSNEQNFYRKDGSVFFGAVTASVVKDEAGKSAATVFIIKDISLRRQLEEQLQRMNEALEEKVQLRTAEIIQSERRFRTLIENNHDVITLMDESFKLIYRSPAATRVTGWTNEDMINAEATKNIHPEDQEPCRLIVQQAMANPGVQYNTSFRNLHKDGHYIWLEGVLTNCLHDENLRAFIHNFHDVTQRKLSEQKLLESEQRYRTTLDNMLEGVQIIGFDWKFIYVNDALARHSKYSREQLIGHTVQEMFPGIEQSPLYKVYERCFNERATIQMENEFEFPDRSIAWFELSFQPVPEGIFILSVDITERKKAEEKLNEQRVQLQTLSDNLPGVMIYQLVGKRQGDKRFTYLSNGVTAITGRTPEAVMEDASIIYDAIFKDDVPLMLEAERKSLETMCVFNVEIRFNAADGSRRWLNIVSTPRWTKNGQVVWDGFHIDVTERKHAEQAIKESEKHYRLLVEQSVDGIFLADAQGNYIDANSAGCKMLGYSHDEITTKNISDIIIKEEIPNIAALPPSFAGGAISTTEWHFVRKDGSIFLGEVIGRQFEDGRMQGILRDITERRIAEEKLQISEQRFRSIIEQYPSPIIRYTPEGELITANPAWETMWEDKLENVKGYNIRKDRQLIGSGLHASIEKAFAGEVVMSDAFEYDPALIGKKGKKRWIQMLMYPLKDAREILNEVIVITIDITDNREAHEKLVASEKKFRNLLDSMLEGIQIIDRNWKYTYVNDSLVKYSRYTKEELIGSPVTALYPGVEGSELYQTLQRCMNGQQKEHLETEFVFPDGSKTIFELSIQSVPEGLFILSVDITERKLSEERIKQLNTELEERVALRTEQLRKINEELEAFSYSVSHDLRAPLRGIIGFTNILEDDYSSKLDEEAKRITGVIKSNTIKMGNLIDDLLSFSRVGRQQVDKTVFNTNEMVAQIISNLQDTDNPPAIEWVIPSLHTTWGDINAIRQVWVNLLSNAVKYSSGMESQRIEVGSYLLNNQVVFFVKDNGVGFDKKYTDKLFKVFQRLHGASEFEGTGVGLAIVEKIISKHEGRVWAEGETGRGAVFYFSLPIDAENNIEHNQNQNNGSQFN